MPFASQLARGALGVFIDSHNIGFVPGTESKEREKSLWPKEKPRGTLDLMIFAGKIAA
jgi:hypothetical protein